MFKLMCIAAIIVIGAHRAEAQNFRALGYDEEGPCILPAYDRDLGATRRRFIFKAYWSIWKCKSKIKKVINSKSTFFKISS